MVRSAQHKFGIRSVAFGIAAAAIPFVLLALIELSLRFAGVDGTHHDSFIELPEREGIIVFNPLYPARYFQSFAPSVSFDPFMARKDPGSFRIVVLGGSSAAGFPYSQHHAFPSLLRDRLRRYAFGQGIEVISLAMTAVNSYTIWDLSDDVVAIEPDAVVIYAGHNEFYGAFGPGSSEYGIGLRIWPKRLLLRLKNLVLFRLLEKAVLGAGSLGTKVPGGRTMMARAVRGSGIPYESEAFLAATRQFETNLTDILEIFREAGIPVFVGTLASNLADQPPLGTDEDAIDAYRMGLNRLVSGDTLTAADLLRRARDLDDIRFRAPDTLNTLIRTVAGQNGAVVVETNARLELASAGGITGASLFDDHLHPNYHGYALMADEFFDAIRNLDKLNAAPLAGWQEPVDMLDPVDKARADLQIARLKGGYPFKKDIDLDDELAAYESVLARYQSSGNPYDSLAVLTLVADLTLQEGLRQGIRSARASRDTLNAIKLSKSLLYWQPFNLKLMDDFVGYASSSGTFDEVNRELTLASYSLSNSPFHLNTLAALSLRQGHLHDALRLLDMVEAVDPTNRVMLYNKARTLILTGDTLAARTYVGRYQSGQ